MIKFFEQFNIDPYGEENWDEGDYRNFEILVDQTSGLINERGIDHFISYGVSKKKFKDFEKGKGFYYKWKDNRIINGYPTRNSIVFQKNEPLGGGYIIDIKMSFFSSFYVKLKFENFKDAINFLEKCLISTKDIKE
jgi:hypothetical protein